MRRSGGAVSFYLVVVCTLLAAGLTAAGVVWGIERHPVAAPVEAFHAPPYVELWYAEGGELMGLRTDGGRVMLDHWPVRNEQRVDQNVPQSVEVDIPPEALTAEGDRLFARGESGKAVAWISKGRVACQRIEEDGATGVVFTDLVPDARLKALAVLDSGLVAVVYTDGTVESWECDAGATKHQQMLDIVNPRRIRVAGEYVAADSTSPPAMVVQRMQPDGEWPVVEKRYQARSARWWLSPTGQLVVEDRGGLLYGRDAVAAPGRVDDTLVFGSGATLYASGSFDGIHRLRPGEDPMKVMAVPEGLRTLDGHSGWIVFSNTEGTRLRQISRGRQLTTAGVLCFILALLALAFPMLRSLVGGLLHRSVGEMVKRERLRERDRKHELPKNIPTPMVEAMAAGRLYLFAGMGLSAQAGLPRWVRFVDGLVVWAVEQRVIDQKRATALLRQTEAGDRHAVVDEIVASAASARGLLRQHYRKTFEVEGAGSAVHRKMAKVPFGAAVTTNYDHLLETSHAPFTKNILTPNTPLLWETVRSGSPFMLKLRGDFDTESEALLSPENLAFVVNNNRGLRQVIDHFFSHGTVAFIGCTCEELLHDLQLLGVEGRAPHPHFALLAVSDDGWQMRAEVLETRFGIHSMPYDEEAAEEELYGFLAKLADLHDSAGEMESVKTRG